MKKRFPKSASRLRSGFTLVEMLVVITIIVVLLTLLFPAVARVRDIAHKRACASHMRAITQNLVVYATDHQGEYPSYKAVPIGTESYPMAFTWGIESSNFYSEYLPDRSVYFCPADLARSFNSRAKRSFQRFPKKPPGLNESNISYVYFFGRRDRIPKNSTNLNNRRGGYQFEYHNVNPAQTTMIADTMRLRGSGKPKFYTEIHNEDYWNHYGDTLKESGGHLGYADGHVKWWSGADHFPVEYPRWARRMNGANDHVFVAENPYIPDDPDD